MKYPELKTKISALSLSPLKNADLPFLANLFNSPSVNATLFRTPKKISPEKLVVALDKMYESEKPKEITYILKVKAFLAQKPIGYVKIKLIDWEVESCYLSTAIIEDPEYRGKGYAKAAYDSFFDFLFSIGISKIYGRTYETNDSTIALNEATGFSLIGRQQHFIVYPNNKTLDALLFERIDHKKLSEKSKLFLKSELAAFTEIANMAKEQCQGDAFKGLDCFRNTYKKYSSYLESSAIIQSSEILRTEEEAASVDPQKLSQLISNYNLPLRVEISSSNNISWFSDHIKVNLTTLSRRIALSLLMLSIRFTNALSSEHPSIGILLTKDQLNTHNILTTTIYNILCGNHEWKPFDQKLLWGAAFTESTTPYFSRLTLGREFRFDIIKTLAISKQLMTTV